MTDVDGRMVAWLNGCYDRAEEKARAATPGPWHVANADYEYRAATVDGPDGAVVIPKDVDYGPTVELGDAEHIAAHDPSWRLADIARKRAILAAAFRYEAMIDGEEGCGHSAEDIMSGTCPERRPEDVVIARLLAEEFADQPGYREEWRP